MYYVKGYELKKAGPFVAKQWFEGLTDDIVSGVEFITIDGVEIPKVQIILMEKTQAKVATLNMSGTYKAKKCESSMNSALETFDHQVGLLDSGLKYSVVKNTETRMVPNVDFESIAMDIKFIRAVLSKTDPTDRRIHTTYIQQAKDLYAREFNRVITAPKYPKMRKQK